MTQLQSTSANNQQHVRPHAGQWLRRGNVDEPERAHLTQREAIRAAQRELLAHGGGQIMIEVPPAGIAEDDARLPDLPEFAMQAGNIEIQVVEGVPIFRAAEAVQNRIADLLFKLREEGLSQDEEKELDQYEDVDYYFSRLNRLLQTMYLNV